MPGQEPKNMKGAGMNKVDIEENRRFWVSLLMITLAFGFMAFTGESFAAGAPGADYPSRPVTFLSLSAPGSGFDTTTRAVVNTLVREKMVKVPLPVENASNSVAGTANMVNRYKGDPYTLSVHSLNGMMRYATGGSPYSHKDYTPLCGLISTYYGVAVRYDSPYKTLGDLVNRQIGELSGGQQQRMFIARALAQEAELMLMDEPFTGLDAPSQEAIFSILENLKQRRVTVLIAMHDLNLAAERFEKVMLLNHRLIGFGNPKQIFTPEQLRLAYGHHLHLVGAGETWLALEDTCCDEGEQA